MTAASSAPFLVAVAVGLAGVGGWCLAAVWTWRREAVARRRARSRRLAREGAAAPESGDRVMRYAAELSMRLAAGAASPLLGRARMRRPGAWFEARARRAGVEGEVSAAGFAEACVRLALAACAFGSLLGAVISTELAAVGAIGGLAWGAFAPARAVRRATKLRAGRLGGDLPEMLEVVALGLRSGLSFDRSFGLYGAHFETRFARECAAAQRSWSLGLATREEALRSLAASYDSAVLARVVEGVVRSLRFGASLAEVLESAAAEARADHRACVEERVAKAPVKMMVPTGTLILPAMLLLVLGPVLLELMEGM